MRKWLSPQNATIRWIHSGPDLTIKGFGKRREIRESGDHSGVLYAVRIQSYLLCDSIGRSVGTPQLTKRWKVCKNFQKFIKYKKWLTFANDKKNSFSSETLARAPGSFDNFPAFFSLNNSIAY